ncbi:MAG: NUDIX domain-containing protein, partial [Anaerolineales bacterium]
TIALDGNLRRVLSRLFDIADPLPSAAAERRFQARALAMLPAGQASAFNQALMDLGATICTPTAPSCEECPLHRNCVASLGGFEKDRPVRQPRGPLPWRQRVAAVITEGSKVLLGRRPRGGLLSGLWEFPGDLLQAGEQSKAGLARIMRESLAVDITGSSALTEIEHTYTHYRVRAQAYKVETEQPVAKSSAHEELRWVPMRSLAEYPMGKVDRAIARRLAESQSNPNETATGHGALS